MNTRVTAGVCVAVCLGIARPGAAGDAILTWSGNLAKASVAACLQLSGNALVEARMYAIAHASMHDAVNAIQRRFHPYAFDGQLDPSASPEAAIAAAARDTLVAVIARLPESPACQADGIASVESDYAEALAAIADGPAKLAGIAIGRAAAAAILARRDGDGSDAPMVDFDFPQGTAPGEWRFTPLLPVAFGTLWGEVTPFVLNRGEQFRPPPPYPLVSAQYAADLNEVKALGGDGPTTPSARTPDQTQIGLFWIESSPFAWNRLTRTVSASRGLDLWENARLFGLLNLAMADGYIASWNAKYHFLFWRPVTAIQLADVDGNPATERDATWTPLQLTYPMPDHPSGHAAEGGAAAEVLRRVFGTDHVSFTACSHSLPPGQRCDDAQPVTRAFTSFTQAETENALSRIYIGIHFRKAVVDGVAQGRHIARRAVALFLRPVGQ